MAKHRKAPSPAQLRRRLIEMLESPAHRALSLSAPNDPRSRIEIELAATAASQENGQLPCTFDDFVEYGSASQRDRARA